MTNAVHIAIAEVKRALRNGYYGSMEPWAAKIIHQYSRETLRIPEVNRGSIEDIQFQTQAGAPIAHEYKQVIIGDMGPCVEFDLQHIDWDLTINKWPGKSLTESLYYVWHRVKQDNTKIYLQLRSVDVATYQPGMTYIYANDLYYDGQPCSPLPNLDPLQ